MQQNTNSVMTLHIDNHLVWLCCTSGKIRCVKPCNVLFVLVVSRQKVQLKTKIVRLYAGMQDAGDASFVHVYVCMYVQVYKHELTRTSQ